MCVFDPSLTLCSPFVPITLAYSPIATPATALCPGLSNLHHQPQPPPSAHHHHHHHLTPLPNHHHHHHPHQINHAAIPTLQPQLQPPPPPPPPPPLPPPPPSAIPLALSPPSQPQPQLQPQSQSPPPTICTSSVTTTQVLTTTTTTTSTTTQPPPPQPQKHQTTLPPPPPATLSLIPTTTSATGYYIQAPPPPTTVTSTPPPGCPPLIKPTPWNQSYGMEHVWMAHFTSLFKSYPHQWCLIPVEQRPLGGNFLTFVDSAKVRFCCEDCGHGWTSMKGRVAFWFDLTIFSGYLAQGLVAFKLFGQQCQKCKAEIYEPPMWYPEEVFKVLVNLFNKVGQNYYGFYYPPLEKTRRPGKPRTPHNSTLCQACKDGVCTNRK